MEDLVPLIFFLVIVAVNVLKFFIEKGGKAKAPSAQTQEEQPRRTSALEQFFGDLAEQMAPKPTELADWPEGRERPDYAQEMDEFLSVQLEEEEQEQQQVAEIIPFEVPEPAVRIRKKETPPVRHPTDFQIKGKKELRQAMLGHMVFGPPRAFDLSFDNTLTREG